MKATITDLKTFRSLLMVLKKNRASSGSLPILTKTLIRTKNNVLEFIATDLEITKILRLEADIEEEGSILVDLMALDKLVVKLKKIGGPVILQDDPESENANGLLSHSRIESRLLGSPLDQYPTFIEEVDSDPQIIDSEKLRAAFDSVSTYISSDVSRQNLTGAYLTGNNVVATDGHRLRKVKVNNEVTFDDVIFPGKAVDICEYGIKKLKVDVASYRYAKKEGDDGYVQIDFGPHTVTSKVIKGEFPDFSRTVPTPSEDDCVIKVSRDEILEGISILEALKGGQETRCRLKTNPFELYYSHVDTGEGTTPLTAIEQTGNEQNRTVYLNMNYLKAAVKDLTANAITFRILDTLSPVTLTEEENPEGITLVMPMKK